MKYVKRITATFLAMLLLISTMPMSVFAAEVNTPKEEVVYININHDGSVREIYVVNIFELDEEGQIIDFGEYESLRNMTTTDELGYSDGKVTIDTKAGKLYYEGKLKSNVIPWDIKICYFMDGKEYSAKEIAGKNGALKITMSIRQNADCNSTFFEGYALQATFVLDTENCKNIMAENATIANVGSDKQLTFTILPNKETNLEITADVTNFEMDAIAINGVQLNMDIEIDDAKLQDKIKEITDAVNEIDKGANDLYESTNDLHEGVATLSAGADDLYSGLSALNGKNDELVNGALTAFSALCAAAQTQLNAELAVYGLETVTLTPDNYSAVLSGMLDKMGTANGTAGKIAELKGQLDNYNFFYQGLVAYTSGVAEVTNGASDLKDGVLELQGGTNDLNEGAKELVEGTGTFVKETEGMDEEVSGEIDSLISAIAGSNAEIVSFVSEHNTDVKAVQFVIKTDVIQMEEAETVEVAVEETLNFWQKLLRLFGLY